MKRFSLILAVIVGFIFVSFTASVYADVPQVINYQGKLTDKDDTPLSGNYLVTFRFYEVSSEGTPVWEEGHILTVRNGMFNALLGSIKPFDIDFNKGLWLGIEVGSDGEMSPRIKLASSAYALNSETVDMLDSHQLIRNDIDAVMSGKLTLKKDLILRGDATEPSRIVMTNKQGREYYLWIDNSGDLRIKQGLPASDRDGDIIGKGPDIKSARLIQNITPLMLLFVILVLGFVLYSTKKK